MRELVAIPVILLAVMLQTSVVSHITILSGFGDLPLVMLAAWALQDEVESAWHWAAGLGLLVGFISGISWVVPVLGYLAVVTFAKIFQRRVWQAPLLAMFSVTFLATISMNLLSLIFLRLTGVVLPISDALGLVTLPAVLLNMLYAVPVYAIMRDLAGWTYPSMEAG